MWKMTSHTKRGLENYHWCTRQLTIIINVSNCFKSKIILVEPLTLPRYASNLSNLVTFLIRDCTQPFSKYVNSLTPGRYTKILNKNVSKCKFWQIYHIIFPWNWSGMDANVLKSTLGQVMAWCRQATSHNLSQYWPRSMSTYGVIGGNELMVDHFAPCGPIPLWIKQSNIGTGRSDSLRRDEIPGPWSPINPAAVPATAHQPNIPRCTAHL